MAESTVTRAWYPKGSCPKVKSYPGHKSVAYSGFVLPETGELFVTKPDWFNYETTITCIREFLASHPVEDGKHLYIVMDNAPWHKKAKRLINEDEQYADIKKTATIISLPPYSPDLNPIEQVWRITRREKTHNRFWETLEKLVGVLDNWFSTFKKPNDKLATLCSFAWSQTERINVVYYKVPEDVAVVGYDDFLASHAVPPMSSVKSPLEDMAAAAINIIHENNHSGGEFFARTVALTPKLIVRESSRIKL